MLTVYVVIFDSEGKCVTEYEMDHHNPADRRRLGEGCRDAFEAGGSVVTTTSRNFLARLARGLRE